MCLADAFFINTMKVNFSPSQITTIFKWTEPQLMRVPSTSLIFTKYLPLVWSWPVLPQHLLTIYLMYKQMSALFLFSYNRRLSTFKIKKRKPKSGQAYLWGISKVISGTLGFNNEPKHSKTPSQFVMKEMAQPDIGKGYCQSASQNRPPSMWSKVSCYRIWVTEWAAPAHKLLKLNKDSWAYFL